MAEKCREKSHDQGIISVLITTLMMAGIYIVFSKELIVCFSPVVVPFTHNSDRYSFPPMKTIEQEIIELLFLQ